VILDTWDDRINHAAKRRLLDHATEIFPHPHLMPVSNARFQAPLRGLRESVFPWPMAIHHLPDRFGSFQMGRDIQACAITTKRIFSAFNLQIGAFYLPIVGRPCGLATGSFQR